MDKLRQFLKTLGGVRMVPITHISKPGQILCDRKVLCGDYREGEAVCWPLHLASCPECRRIEFKRQFGG